MIKYKGPIDYDAISADLPPELENRIRAEFETLFKATLDEVMQSAGAGAYQNQTQTFMYGLDRFQRNILPMNSEFSGFTFITRPRLCLQDASLAQSRSFAPLMQNPVLTNSIPFAIRCLLDTKFSSNANGRGTHVAEAAMSSLFDYKNPFFTPLCNALTGVSGWPDMAIQTLTTDTGFHSEDQTYAIGYDNLAKSYPLNLNFKDIQDGPIAAIFFYWLMYIANVTKGTMLAYADDIDQRRLNYTVSIYRFNVDPTRTRITKWAKATGCFPTGMPIGAMFNFDESETFVPASGKFSIPFIANHIAYNDYMIFEDFNRLVRKYTQADSKRSLDDGITTWKVLKPNPSSNYRGIPYITTANNRPKVIFCDPPDVSAVTDPSFYE